MNEELLTSEEISKIIDEAKNPKYIDPSLIHLGKNKTSIFKVSPKSGLILIYGNEWTGRLHIDNRHNLTSRIPYWNKNKEIGNPTKFSLEIGPLNYIDLADKIYQPKNLNNAKNQNIDVFDVYIGTSEFIEFPELEYTLILYKGTKIIHTLFLSSNKKPFNKKKILNLRQGWAVCSQNLKSGTETYEIPYFDSNDIVRAKIILESVKSINKDKWFIQINDIDISPRFIKEEDCYNSTPPQIRLTQLDFTDLAWIEKEIKKILNDTNNF